MGNFQTIEDNVKHKEAKSFMREVYQNFQALPQEESDDNQTNSNNNNNNNFVEEDKQSENNSNKQESNKKRISTPKNFLRKLIKKKKENTGQPAPTFIVEEKKKELSDLLVECFSDQNARIKNFNLIIGNIKIGDNIMQSVSSALSHNEFLVTLKLINCKLSSNAIEHLSNSLTTNKILRHLDLSGNSMNNKDFEVLERGLKSNHSIQNIYLSNTKMNDEGLLILSNYFRTRKLKVVDLAENEISNNGFSQICEIVSSNVFLVDFRVRENPEIDNDKTKKLGQLLIRNESVVYILQTIIEKTFIARNIKLRATQTEMSRYIPQIGDDEENVQRTRGRTVNANAMLPSVAQVFKEVDYGNTLSKRYKYGFASTQGRRKTMEDTMLFQGRFNDNDCIDMFCVFDGHGSQESSIFVATHLPTILKKHLQETNDDYPRSLKQTFVELNEKLSPFAIQHGTTAVVVLIVNDILYAANVGDSRAVLCRNGVAIRLTVDHHPDLPGETERIEDLGGCVLNGRVRGVLAVTRALGDSFAGELISAEPYLVSVPLNSSDTFLLLACDGLFEAFTDEEAIEVAKRYSDPQEASEKLKNQAFAAGSNDNISCAVIHLGTAHQHIAPDPSHSVNIIYGLYQPKCAITEVE